MFPKLPKYPNRAELLIDRHMEEASKALQKAWFQYVDHMELIYHRLGEFESIMGRMDDLIKSERKTK